MSLQPCYLDIDLVAKRDQAMALLSQCTLCPHRCGVNRLAGQLGRCQTGAQAEVASFGAHLGEEACLRGTHGSGTIFFQHCNLLCKFCQNWDISQGGPGRCVTDRELADIMLELAARGCHNINFVTPSHVVPQILAALALAVADGLRLPLVYNTGGYDAVSTLALLEGVFDIYMPDFKFSDAQRAARLTCVPDYPQVVQAALREMHRQVGDLVLDAHGLAVRGILLRHLVMPAGWAGTAEVMRFVHDEISPRTFVNIMAQYHPNLEMSAEPELNRTVTWAEYQQAVAQAKAVGLTRFDH